MSDKPLTLKQEMFCKEYIKDFNGTRAAMEAGYSKKTAYKIASENLRKPQIIKRLREEIENRKERVDVDQDYVLDVLTETVELNRQKTLVHAVRMGIDEETGEPKPELTHVEMHMDSNNVRKSAELIGKHFAMFTENHNHSGHMTLPMTADLHAKEVMNNQVAALEKPPGVRE